MGVGGFTGLPYWQDWTRRLGELQAQVPSMVGRCRLAADMWVEMWTQVLAVRGIAFGIASSAACTLLGLLLFTSNLFVSLLAMMSLLAIVVVTLGTCGIALPCRRVSQC
jgi:hypothetical protein